MNIPRVYLIYLGYLSMNICRHNSRSIIYTNRWLICYRRATAGQMRLIKNNVRILYGWEITPEGRCSSAADDIILLSFSVYYNVGKYTHIYVIPRLNACVPICVYYSSSMTADFSFTKKKNKKTVTSSAGAIIYAHTSYYVCICDDDEYFHISSKLLYISYIIC